LGQLSPTQQQQLLLEFKQIAQGLSQAGPSSKTSRMLLQQELIASAADPAMDQLASPSWQGLQAPLPSPQGSTSPQLPQPQQQQPQLAGLPAGNPAVSEASTGRAVHAAGTAAPAGIVNITTSELEHLMLLRSMKATLPTVQEGLSQTTDAAAGTVAATISPTYLDQQQQQQLYVRMESSSSSLNSSGTCFSRSYSSSLSPTNPTELHDANTLSIVALSEALASVPYFTQQQQQLQLQEQQLQLQEQQLQQQLQYHQQQQQLVFTTPVPEEGIYTVPAQPVTVNGQDLASLLNPMYSTPGGAAAVAAGGTLLPTGNPTIPGQSALMSNLLGQSHTMLPAAAGLGGAAGGFPIANFNSAATTAAAAAAAAAGVGPWPLVPPGSTCRLFIGNLGWWVDEQLLLDYFGKCGQVVDIQVGHLKNFGGVQCLVILSLNIRYQEHTLCHS
jgi:hypothetical protein